MVTKYAIHPLVEVFQPYDEERYETLRDSIKGYGGLRQPITVWRGAVIDGRHRYKACVELGLEPWVVELDEYADPLDAVVDLNGVRRQMTTAQRALAAARIANLSHGGDRKSKQYQETDSSLDYTLEAVTKKLGVGTTAAKIGKGVLESGEDDVIAEIDAGNLSINKAQIRITERAAAREREERAAAVRAEIEAQNERKRKEREERELFERERERLERESAAPESGEGAAVSLDIAAPDGGITIIDGVITISIGLKPGVDPDEFADRIWTVDLK